MLARRALLIGLASGAMACASTPRTLPLAIAVGQRGMEAAAKLDLFLQGTSAFVAQFQRASCTFAIVSRCETPAQNQLRTLPGPCLPDPSRDQFQDNYRATIVNLRELVGHVRAGYSAYYDLASFDAGGAVRTTFDNIAKTASAFPGAGEDAGRLVGLVGAIFSSAVREHQARKLLALNTFYAAVYTHMNAWWRGSFQPEVVATVLGSADTFDLRTLPTQCFAAPGVSEALPFRNENIRTAMRQATYPNPLTTEIATIAGKLSEVNLGLQALEIAHRSLAADRASVGDALGVLDNWLTAGNVGR